ncbi:EGF-like membrane protein, putative [Hepatocystis sp. ex Piliocolobus tephrosceles]|nr:EGF-like membrane protein, putative [Hepatocystis sp. ex Piliocolobus tephrosceles]
MVTYLLIIKILLVLYFYYNISPCICLDCNPNHLCKNNCFVLNNNKQVCLCNANEKGVHCKEKWNVCENDCNISELKGTCSAALCKSGICESIDNPPYYKCNCGNFFEGPNCEIENNPCSNVDTNPCLNGTCIFIIKLNKIICKCNNGWTQKDKLNASMLTWGNSRIEVPPPCDEKVKKGLSKYVIYHTPVSYAIWWIIYILSVLVLFVCCCNMCYDFLSNSLLNYFALFKNKKKD